MIPPCLPRPRKRGTLHGLRTFLRRYADTPTRPYAVSLFLLLAGCATNTPQASPFLQSAAIDQQIAAEPVGDFYIGRRVYSPPFAIWGYVRSPRQNWKTAKLVILNEKFQFAPDRVRIRSGPTMEVNTGFTAIFQEIKFMMPPPAGSAQNSC